MPEGVEENTKDAPCVALAMGYTMRPAAERPPK